MLTHQVKVILDREVHQVLTRLSRRNSGTKGALVRRIALTGARGWERKGPSARVADSESFRDDEASGFDVAVKVLFSEHDLQLITRMAESEGVSTARCIRQMVSMYVKRIAADRRAPEPTAES
jgi:hypothetical protein